MPNQNTQNFPLFSSLNAKTEDFGAEEKGMKGNYRTILANFR
jgi:hypothetical protein